MRILNRIFPIGSLLICFATVGENCIASGAVAAGNDSVTVTNWSLSLAASAGELRDSSASFGVRPDATADYDPAYDVPRPPDPPGDYLMAYFPHSGGLWPSLLGSKFASDFTSPVGPVWWLVVEMTAGPGTITLSWDTSEIRTILGDVLIWMRDSAGGQVVNLTNESSYSFSHTGPRSFCIWAESKATYFTLKPSWNLISLPRIPEESSWSALFPSAASSAFSYEGQYVFCDTLTFGKGYWLKFDREEIAGLTGSSVSSFEIPVEAGWNIIGALTQESAAPIGGILTSRFFGYDGNYFVAETLKPGSGYWVKSSAAGSIHLGDGGLAGKSAEVLPTFEPGVVISATDRNNSRQDLYLVGVLPGPDMFELPPPPPAGTFDLRFASHRFLERVGTEPGLAAAIKIKLQARNYPVRFEVDRRAPAWQLKFFSNGRLLFDSDEAGTGNSFIINDPATREISLQVDYKTSASPGFELKQNYPNPFNPATMVEYNLGEQSYVRLRVINALGEEVATLANGIQKAGLHEAMVDGASLRMASGVYFYRLDATGEVSGIRCSLTRKLIFIK